jgi:hypothetical protein
MKTLIQQERTESLGCRFSVHNIAVRPDGSQRDIRGTAKVLNPPQNTKLAVHFHIWFGPLIPVPKAGK